MTKRSESDRKLREKRGEFVRPRCCGFTMSRLCKRTRKEGKLRWLPRGWECEGQCGRMVRDRDLDAPTEPEQPKEPKKEADKNAGN